MKYQLLSINLLTMGIDNGHNVIFKAESVVSSELNSMLDLMKTSQLSNLSNVHPKKKRIDCDISNIIHQLANGRCRIYSIELVRDVAKFLKKLAADSGFIVTAILDGDVRPQSKRDAFNRRYQSTMARINSYYCRQLAMKIAAKGDKMN